MKKKIPRVVSPQWIKQIVKDSMLYDNLAKYGYARDRRLLADVLEQLKERIKLIGN